MSAQRYFLPTLLDGYPRERRAVQMQRVSAEFNPAQRTRVLYLVGQSQIANSVTFTPGSPLADPTGAVHVFNPCDGGMYQARQPLLGCSSGIASLSTKGIGWNLAAPLAQQRLTAGQADRIILVPLAIGGVSVQNWDPAWNPFRYNLFASLQTAARRLAAIGITPATAPHLILCDEGTTDAGASPTDITQAFFAARMSSWIARTRAADNGTPSGGAGLVCPWVIARHTYPFTSAAANVRAAIAGLVGGSGQTAIHLGPDLDTLTGSNRDTDNIHFTPAGATNAATLWNASITAIGGDWA